MLASSWQPDGARGVGFAVALVLLAGRAAYRRARRRASATDSAPEAAGSPDESAGRGNDDASRAFAQRDEGSRPRGGR